MELPQTTSELLALQGATNAELHARLAGIFQRYRKLAFIGRNDNLFTEHWTPEVAAAVTTLMDLKSRAQILSCTALRMPVVLFTASTSVSRWK